MAIFKFFFLVRTSVLCKILSPNASEPYIMVNTTGVTKGGEKVIPATTHDGSGVTRLPMIPGPI